MARNVAFDGAETSGNLQESDQSVDEFIYLMSHDLRGSLRAMTELPNWVAEDLAEANINAPASVATSLEMIKRHSARLDQMLVDLLAYSRIGKHRETASGDLNALLDQVVGGLRLPEGMQIQRDIKCKDLRIGHQDALHLFQALIGNAVKHHDTMTGIVRISVQVEGTIVRVGVSDDGPGISENHYAKAQCAMTTLRPRDEVEGTGMGLASVTKIARHYGGYMTLAPAKDSPSGLQVEVVFPYDWKKSS